MWRGKINRCKAALQGRKMLRNIIPTYEDNELCEICQAHWEPDYSQVTFDIYCINTHCIELRRNREARKHKNTKPKQTVF